MSFSRGCRVEFLLAAWVAVGCGGGKFISVDQDNSVTGGKGGDTGAGGATLGNTTAGEGGETVGGGATTGGNNNEAGADGSGGEAATGGSPTAQSGANSMGGLLASGGAPSSGGNAAPTGGARTSGGNLNSGGSPQSSGGTKTSLSTGGMRPSGGHPATGGMRPVTGGDGSTGGSFMGSGGNSSSGGLMATGGQSSVTLTFGERANASCTGLTIDTSLSSANPELNYGLAPLFGCDASPLGVGLVQFILGNCVNPIGTLNKVLAARLRLHTGACTGCQSSPNTTVQVFELLESWEEGSGPDTGQIGTANWNERQAGVAWSGAGASGASRGALVTSFKPASVDAEYVIELPSSLVQRWLDDPANNFGLLFSISSTAVSPTDAVSFVASDGDKPLSPLLEIDFAAN